MSELLSLMFSSRLICPAGERVLLAQGSTDEFIQPTLRFYNIKRNGKSKEPGHAHSGTACSAHDTCGIKACKGRCSRFTRKCICDQQPFSLSLSDTHSHWKPYKVPNLIGDFDDDISYASTHPLDEFSELMPDLTVLLGESIDTEWHGSVLKHRLRMEVYQHI